MLRTEPSFIALWSIQSEKWRHCLHAILVFGFPINHCITDQVPLPLPQFFVVVVFFSPLAWNSPVTPALEAILETQLGCLRSLRVADRRERGWGCQDFRENLSQAQEETGRLPRTLDPQCGLLFLVIRHTHVPHTAHQKQYSGDRPYLCSMPATLGKSVLPPGPRKPKRQNTATRQSHRKQTPLQQPSPLPSKQQTGLNWRTTWRSGKCCTVAINKQPWSHSFTFR